MIRADEIKSSEIALFSHLGICRIGWFALRYRESCLRESTVGTRYDDSILEEKFDKIDEATASRMACLETLVPCRMDTYQFLL